ncbi:glucose-methanol-choline oxidoreductase [Burkholderia stagnalis]|uniref:GMC family oxidoreductase n=1 Tax=Burkholderia stagnalis TaxID=1503054 RepID=UPI00075C4F61|nr:GMC family oxidoreductase N-terminal domain-containing protein [Burkholderia stagnalis]AOK55518.1 glucose-methanol-choline oxidoreductase [Burkholderia stagnalis]KVN68577.1 glucose-methanol-choline oxidoreductase [Burkholderia stagnalis]KWO27587.1 glucose-methanol-choline oxidoreductase [Burkholderia stagnalis]KWO36153.1 glucose-methanol-choline oxidoreductase [Burkholderia stagnalis]MDY7805272.1 GMC family oxidoreductase N-terminal domain-containing protein [Burkholderia stagnalis]
MTRTFDYIVVGGGSGGCVVAGRLTERPDVTVCVLEAGNRGDGTLVNVPTGAVAMMPTRINNWAFETVPQPGLGGRRGYQPRGKALGGSSAINAMVYIRGHRSDYDHWAALGNDGWAFDDVLPYFRLSEHNERFDDAWHGRDGPLWVSDLRTGNPFHARYLEAARQAGLPLTDDFNGAQQEGIGLYQVTQKHGERWSAARAYLLPHVGRRDNLTVETHAQVLRILFDGTRAIGVEVRQHGEVRTLRARREVVLAAGAFQTPQLLMLSGVGPAAELARVGIRTLADLPGVGRNLQDHPDFIFGYRTRSVDTLGVSAGGGLRMLRELLRFRRERRGMLTSNFAEGGGFLKTRAELDAPNIQLHFVVALVDDHARRLHTGHGMSCHVCLLRPRSRGAVTLQSADPLAAPRIDPAFFDDPRDLDDMVAGFKLTRRLMQAPALAGWITRDLFTANVTTDDEIRDVLRQRTDTVYHPVGTCRMGRDALAVVDPQLRVRGLQGLRIVDASVMPTLIGGNTNAPTIMIAEKAVDLMRGASRVSIQPRAEANADAQTEAAPTSDAAPTRPAQPEDIRHALA